MYLESNIQNTLIRRITDISTTTLLPMNSFPMSVGTYIEIDIQSGDSTTSKVCLWLVELRFFTHQTGLLYSNHIPTDLDLVLYSFEWHVLAERLTHNA